MNVIAFSEVEHQSQTIDELHLESILKDFRKDGYVVLRDVFAKAYIDALNGSFIRQYNRYFVDAAHDDALRVGDKRFQITVELNDVFNSSTLYANPLIYQIMEQLFDYQFIVNSLTCTASLPGAGRMSVHRDGSIFDGHPIAHLLPPHAVGVLIPLIPITELNGPTRIWPGSHLRRAHPDDLEHDTNFIDAIIDTGSCLLMDYRVYHTGNPNLSDQVRPLLYLLYSTPWYYDERNFRQQAALIIDDANFQQIPPPYRTLFERRQAGPTVWPVATPHQ